MPIWLQGRELQEAVSGAKSGRWHLACGWRFYFDWKARQQEAKFLEQGKRQSVNS
jgi:hypothetical protein